MVKPVTRSITHLINNPSSPSQSAPKIPFPSRKIRKPPTKNSCTKPSTVTVSSILSVTKTLSVKGEIDLALDHLRSSDPLLATLLDTHKPPTYDSQDLPFLSLAKSIIYQQLATKAATSIYSRFIALCGGESQVNPANVLSLSAQQLREIGVSGRKASYLHDLAEKYKSGLLSDLSILEMSDDELLSSLTAVKGIGVWSVHMFMMSSLHRPDVLPVGDLGVRKGVQTLYGLKDLPQALQMEEICEKWRPYRTVGSWYMWRLMDAKAGNKEAKS
ncbi:hypothetical protein K2173_006192 [Erythroxylum novogranatense]|uniref:HhH-GPD domain-containing protein n=1 Tax=Erythroxylum novogranatense TaxID=1862640 RepID=A0AAV8TC60_9ROSI|nr:hypothetical protein K2173_006192 [Erythroxylum novogranatense]